MKAPFKCNKCGAPIELDPYKDFAKCSYCGSTNIFENGRLTSKSDRYLNKFGEYLPKLKQKKVFIPIVIFSTLLSFGIYKVNHIDDFLVKECQIRSRNSNEAEFISKKNYRKCLKNIKNEWLKSISSICKNLPIYLKELKTKELFRRTYEDVKKDAESEYNECLKRKMDELVDRKRACYYSKQAIFAQWEYENAEYTNELFKRFSSQVRIIEGREIHKEMIKNGIFNQRKCSNLLEKQPHLVFGRLKRFFE